jgi:hypothetical protein
MARRRSSTRERSRAAWGRARSASQFWRLRRSPAADSLSVRSGEFTGSTEGGECLPLKASRPRQRDSPGVECGTESAQGGTESACQTTFSVAPRRSETAGTVPQWTGRPSFHIQDNVAARMSPIDLGFAVYKSYCRLPRGSVGSAAKMDGRTRWDLALIQVEHSLLPLIGGKLFYRAIANLSPCKHAVRHDVSGQFRERLSEHRMLTPPSRP